MSLPTVHTTPDLAADFTLPDHLGGAVLLSELLRRAPVVLVFYRGHFCPYCRRYLAKLQAHLPRFRERGVQVMAISPEPPPTSAALARQLELEFPLLSDSTGRVIDAYGVRNGFSSARALLPHPAVFVVAPDRSIRFRSIDRNYKKRTTMRTILQAINACFD